MSYESLLLHIINICRHRESCSMYFISFTEFHIVNRDFIIPLRWADYIWESDVRVQSSFAGRDAELSGGKKGVDLFFLLKHVLYGLLPVWVMRVFLFWCCWPCIPVTVGCSSLSPGAERVLNLDVTQGEGEATSHKGLVSGRPIVNKCVCFQNGMISEKKDICCFPETFLQDLLPCPELTLLIEITLEYTVSLKSQGCNLTSLLHH